MLVHMVQCEPMWTNVDHGTLGIKCNYYPDPSVPCHPSVPHLYGQYMNLSSVPLGFISPLVANTHPTGKYFLANGSSSNWPCDPNSANGRALFHQKIMVRGPPYSYSIIQPYPKDIEILAIQGYRSSPLAFISTKGTLNLINVETRTIYGQRCGLIRFISYIWTLNRVDI